MNQIVQEYIEKNKSEKKKRLVSKLGLIEKKYYDGQGSAEDYPEYEYDEKEKVTRRYRKIPIEITDEEYAELLKYNGNDSQSDRNEKNVVSGILYTIAVCIFIVGFFAGIFLGTDKREGYLLMFIYWIASFIIGMMFIGFSSIIQLLNDIKNK